jgi:hypothetical protein
MSNITRYQFVENILPLTAYCLVAIFAQGAWKLLALGCLVNLNIYWRRGEQK